MAALWKKPDGINTFRVTGPCVYNPFGSEAFERAGFFVKLNI